MASSEASFGGTQWLFDLVVIDDINQVKEDGRNESHSVVMWNIHVGTVSSGSFLPVANRLLIHKDPSS